MNEYNTGDEEADGELQAILIENADLRSEVNNLKKTLDIYGIEEIEIMDDAEAICINQINRIKELADKVILTPEEVKVFDILVKNLLLIRGKDVKKILKGKLHSAAELISIVRDEIGTT